MKAKFKFEIMNALGAILQDEEFKVAYYILNRLALEDTNRVKIYRAMLADLTNKSERTISRITDKLDEKGIIKKDTVSDSKNRYNYYSIHPNIEQSIAQNNTKLGHEEQETTLNLVTDDRFNKKEKKNKNIKIKRNIKEKKQFEIECKNETNTPRDIEVNKDIYTEFQQHIDTMLSECKTEKDLISARALLSSKLRMKTFEIPRNVMNRCNSYLDTKFNELSQVVMAESSTDEDFSFLG